MGRAATPSRQAAAAVTAGVMISNDFVFVITSYSIHYTKLYEPPSPLNDQ